MTVEAGRVVLSRMGRDAGRYFIVVSELDQEFVLMADGALRKAARPKKKRRKHLEPCPETAPELIEKYVRHRLTDSDIRGALERFGYMAAQRPD